MGQREAARITKKVFGLAKFAHTTLGRALKMFVRNIEETAETSKGCRDDKPCEFGKEDEIQHTIGAKCDEQENSVKEQCDFPTTQATATWRNLATQILEVKINRKTLKQFIETCYELAKEWFKKYCRFLL